MNNTINAMNNVNFQAKLDIRQVKGSKQRWQNIAKMFEEKTKKCPNDVFLIEGSFKSGLDLNLLNEGLFSFEEAAILPKATAKLKDLSDNNIVKNLVDIFKYLKKERDVEKKIIKLDKAFKLEKLDEKHGTKFDEKFYDFMEEIRSVRRNEFRENHPIFQKGDLLI